MREETSSKLPLGLNSSTACVNAPKLGPNKSVYGAKYGHVYDAVDLPGGVIQGRKAEWCIPRLRSAI
jgi:hypothetical protein